LDVLLSFNKSFKNLYHIKIETSIIVKSLSGNKAAGHEELTASVLKSIVTSVVKPLAHVFNLSFYWVSFPLE